MNVIRATVPIALIVLSPMAMLYPIWSNPVSAGEDDVVFYYPLRKMVGEALREGRLPLDNVHEAGGAPLMAGPQSAVMYPPTWLFALMDAKLAYSLSVFLGFSLAGGGAYLYLRRVGVLPVAATFGAMAFMFCGFMVGHRVHLSLIHTACYLPWGLWCIERLRRTALHALLWMVAIGFLTITAGHWPTLVHLGVIWTVYLLLRGRPVLRAVGVAAAAVILAAMLTAPQIALTAELLGGVIRQRSGYATAGENSFFPAAAILAFFPMLMGSRTPNFFPQQWWGPWNLCEMLGYIGLLPLLLAAAGVWRMYRKGKTTPSERIQRASEHSDAADLQELLRKWTWIGIGAFALMLGYYLPTYKLIHMLPVLGAVRCPARLLVVVDFALVVLASIAVHFLIASEQARERIALLAGTLRRTATIILPVAMLSVLGLVAIVGFVLSGVWPEKMPFFAGGTKDVLEAVRPANPAVWVPIALLIATGLSVCFWLRLPRRRTGVLIVMLLVDLFFITRFVDVPGARTVVPDPEESPAAAWLKANAPSEAPYRIWGLSETYHHRPAELLLPKTCGSLGFSSIASYGPFQSSVHSHLLGFRIFGATRDWSRLLRRNYLLSLYNVRYILAASPRFRRVIESVQIPVGPDPEEGPNLLGCDWSLRRAEVRCGHLYLRTPFLWSRSIAAQPIVLEADRVYRIRLDACGRDGGAANFLRAEILQTLEDGSHLLDDRLGLTAFAEQMGPEWRHFEWTFRAPRKLHKPMVFRVYTMSERLIQVRGLSLRASHWDRPIRLNARLAPGEAIYRLLTDLRARRAGDPPVGIYENLLSRESSGRASVRSEPRDAPIDDRRRPPSSESIERLKWHADERTFLTEGPPEGPNLAVALRSPPGGRAIVVMGSAVLGYVLLGTVAIRRRILAKSRKNFT